MAGDRTLSQWTKKTCGLDEHPQSSLSPSSPWAHILHPNEDLEEKLMKVGFNLRTEPNSFLIQQAVSENNQ